MSKTIKNKIVYEKDITELKGKANSIVFPDSLEEIQNTIKLSDLDIVPRGSCINFNGSCIPNNSIIIDTSKMNKILEIDATRKLVYVEAGILLDELNLELEKYNLELPISPLFSGLRTIGGIIATNSSGDREIKYGRIKNWIDSLEIINSKGELIEISRADTSDFSGMEGITGVIARAKLRLSTKKIRSLSIFKSESLQDILKLNRKLKLDHDVCMINLISKHLSKLFGLEEKYHLFVEFESNRGNQKNQQYKEFIKLKNNSYYTLASQGYYYLESVKIFMDKFDDFIIHLEENHIPYFSNLGSNIVYFCFKKNQDEIKKQTLQLVKRMRGRLSDGNIGLTKKDFLDKTEIKLIKRIKNRYDSDYRFNRGKVIDYDPEPIEQETESIQTQKSEESERTPEEEIEEFIEEEKVEEILHAEPIEELQEEKPEIKQETRQIEMTDREKMIHAVQQGVTIKKPEVSKEEKDQIRKIASGYMSIEKENKEDNENE